MAGRDDVWVDAEPTPSSDSFGVSLANLVHHVRTFWDHRDEPRVAWFHYADLRADLPGRLRRLADALSISSRRIEQLAAAAIFRSGTSGQWRDVLDAAAVGSTGVESPPPRSRRPHREQKPRRTNLGQLHGAQEP